MPQNSSLSPDPESTRAFYAIGRMISEYQVEFDAPADASDEELEALAVAQLKQEWGDHEEVEIVELAPRLWL